MITDKEQEDEKKEATSQWKEYLNGLLNSSAWRREMQSQKKRDVDSICEKDVTLNKKTY